MDNLKEQLESYCLYLKLLHERMLDKYFKEQAPYLFCKDGCSHCCEKGQYPMSDIEVKYIMIKFASVGAEKRNEILKNIQNVLEERKSCNSTEQFFYRCPFLINGSCSVYENRAIICRTHGLMFFLDDEKGNEKYKMPYCVNLGLNYSNVFDKGQNIITEELIKKVGADCPPQAYNLSLKTLTNKEITNQLGFEFGEIKPLIEWFM